MDEVFLKLPPPKPQTYGYGGGYSAHSATTGASVNMHQYYDRYGGCFHGSCAVTLANGSTKLVKVGQPREMKGPDSFRISYRVMLFFLRSPVGMARFNLLV